MTGIEGYREQEYPRSHLLSLPALRAPIPTTCP